MAKIIACEEVGYEETYDIEVEHDDHQFYLSNGTLTSNSHAVAYSVISYQCAWLLHHYPVEWCAAFLEKEPDTRKEQAISLVKSLGFNVEGLDINTSGEMWDISEDGETLIQPLSSIKGVGDAAIKEIMAFRPFKNVEELLFHDRMSYSKVNKKNLDALTRSGALDKFVDNRFTGKKHFWSAIAVDRPRKKENLENNIKLFKEEGEFSKEEQIINMTELVGVYPIDLVLPKSVKKRMVENRIPPVSAYDPALNLAWFIPKNAEIKKTKNGKEYLILTVIDDENVETKIKCWAYKKEKDKLQLHRVYIAKLDYQEEWGFSTRSIQRNFRLIA